ncbi:MAG: acyltransferase family protein [Eubacteriales bacterium]|nr:acyltransferase family protein [Eubacteriales bacterium]
MGPISSGKLKRDEYWDVVRGLGILAIVLGHICFYGDVKAFVYLFHVPFFFFISGALYNETKYKDKPFEYFGARLKGTWTDYMICEVILIALHNTFVRMGIVPSQEIYSNFDKLYRVIFVSIFQRSEELDGPVWFIPFWIYSAGIFGGLVWAGNKAAELTGRTFGTRISAAEAASANAGAAETMPACRYLFIGILCAAAGFGGWKFVSKHIGYSQRMELSLLLLPITFAGFLLIPLYPKLRKALKNPAVSICMILITGCALRYCNVRKHIYIDLANYELGSSWFYLIFLIGAAFMLALAALTEKVRPAARLMAFFGRYSFYIMVFHIVVVKLIDYVYFRSIGPAAAAVLGADLMKYPSSFSGQLWIVYTVLGMLLPALFGAAVRKLRAVIDR